MNVKITKSDREGKKYKAVFSEDGKKVKTTHFGATGYQDYTQHKDQQRRTNYRSRHRNDNLNDKFSAGALSYYILWNTTDMKKNISLYKKRFNLK